MRGCKSETIESNLSSLRTEHMVQGLDPPNLRPVVVKQLLQGNKNLMNLTDAGLDRASVDIEDLKVIHQNLLNIGLCQHDAVLLWFAMLAMFMAHLDSTRSSRRRKRNTILPLLYLGGMSNSKPFVWRALQWKYSYWI